MAPEMSFAQALNEAKGVIIQLSNRVKADAEKIRAQQARLSEQEAALNRAADAVATMRDRLAASDTAREQAEAIINRQGEKISALQNAAAREPDDRVRHPVGGDLAACAEGCPPDD